MLQRLRAEAVARLCLQHHAVLTGLGEDGGNLPLAEGVVQRIGDIRDLDAQARRGVAVDVQIDLQAAALQIAGHIGQLRPLAQRLDQPRRPLLQQLAVRRLEAELELRAADPVLDGQILHRLQVQLDTWHLGQLRSQPVDDLAGSQVSLAVGLEIDQQAAAVERDVVAIHADVGRQAVHRRIGKNHPRQCLLTLAHGAEGDRLRCLADALDHAGVLHREESLGHGEIEHDGKAKRRNRDQKGQRLVAQYPGQPARVTADQALDPVRLGLDGRLRLEQLGAHHRRQRQRHHQRDQNRHRQGDGELAEQPADHVLHEQQRNQHGDQRESQRDEGETDLFRALQRGVERCLALLQMPRDVLQHDDCIVHHEAGGYRQRHQGQVVQGETADVHHREGADQ